MKSSILTCLVGYIFLFGVANVWADDAEENAALEVLTSSYMMRFYSYLGDEQSYLSVSMQPSSEVAIVEDAIAVLSANENSAAIKQAWASYKAAIKKMDEAWAQGAPSWHEFEDVVNHHDELLQKVSLVAGQLPAYKDASEFLTMMEYYMHRSTPVGYSTPPTDYHYDLAVKAKEFNERVVMLNDEEKINNSALVRWKYIKPAMETEKMYNAPMVMLRHGGYLAKAISDS